MELKKIKFFYDHCSVVAVVCRDFYADLVVACYQGEKQKGQEEVSLILPGISKELFFPFT
jgi:hypothetical protein